MQQLGHSKDRACELSHGRCRRCDVRCDVPWRECGIDADLLRAVLAGIEVGASPECRLVQHVSSPLT